MEFKIPSGVGGEQNQRKPEKTREKVKILI